jgi:hypothetical protein
LLAPLLDKPLCDRYGQEPARGGDMFALAPVGDRLGLDPLLMLELKRLTLAGAEAAERGQIDAMMNTGPGIGLDGEHQVLSGRPDSRHQ